MGFIDDADDISVEIPGMPALSAARTLESQILQQVELVIDEESRGTFWAYWERYNGNAFDQTDPRRAYADAKICAATFRGLAGIFREWAEDQERIAHDAAQAI